MNIQEIHQKQQRLINKKAIENDSKETPKKYKIALNSFNQYLQTSNIKEINNENVNDIILQYIQYQKQIAQLTNNTIQQYMILINNFLRNECNFKLEHIKLPKAEKIKPKYINTKQYQEIMQYLDQQLNQEQTKHQEKIIKTDKTIINLLFNTGLRIHEALKIKIKELTEIEKDKNNIYQLEVIGKGRKPRTVFIISDTYDALMQYIQEYKKADSTYIFESNRTPGIPISTMTIERHFKKIAKEVDAINNIKANDKNSYQELLKPHNLRHSFAVVKLDKGVPINAMQEFLGHENISTTQIYTRLNNDSLSDAMAKTI